MALGTTNISTTIVRNALLESNNSVFSLCTSSLINKWSRYKPIRDAGAGANWPAGPNAPDGYPKYGLNLPTNWDYLQPRGGAPGDIIDEPGRLGDFRGYEHDKTLTYPPIWYDQYLSTNVDGTTLSPTTKDENIIPKDGNWILRKHVAHLSRRLLISELGYANYHWGVRLTSPSPTEYWYKTLGNLNNLAAIPFDLKFTNPSSVTFADFPTNDTIGQWDWILFIASSEQLTWSETAPSDIIFLPEDSDITVINSGHIHVVCYVVFGIGSYSPITALPSAGGNFSYAAGSKTSGYDYGIVNTNYDDAFTVNLDGNTWIHYAVYDSSNTIELTADPDLWEDGCVLRVWCDENTGAPRSPDIEIHVACGGGYSFTVNQAGHPPSFNHNVHGGSWSWTVGPTASANYGDESVYITGTPSGFYSGSGTKTMYVWIMYEGVLVSEVHTFGAKDGMAYTQWISNVDPLEAGLYNIYYSDHDGSDE